MFFKQDSAPKKIAPLLRLLGVNCRYRASCLPEILNLLATLSPHDLMYPDKDGNTVLHLFFTHSIDYPMSINYLREINQTKSPVIEELIEKLPVKVLLMKNSVGRMPIYSVLSFCLGQKETMPLQWAHIFLIIQKLLEKMPAEAFIGDQCHPLAVFSSCFMNEGAFLKNLGSYGLPLFEMFVRKMPLEILGRVYENHSNPSFNKSQVLHNVALLIRNNHPAFQDNERVLSLLRKMIDRTGEPIQPATLALYNTLYNGNFMQALLSPSSLLVLALVAIRQRKRHVDCLNKQKPSKLSNWLPAEILELVSTDFLLPSNSPSAKLSKKNT